jgi:hypothetical protein
MDETLQAISPHHWLEDFRFLLSGAFRGSSEDVQIALLEDRLESRYAPALIPRAYNSLHYSYNWLARNWNYFEEVGMVRREDGQIAVENSLIYALFHFSSDIPLETLPMLPDTPPELLVSVAQKYIEADRENQN